MNDRGRERIHSLVTNDGVQLHAKEIGHGETMLLCNGLFCTDQYYVRWWEHFSRDHHLVTFDYRGHGKSADPADPKTVTIERLVEDAQQVQQALCPEPSILVGHSMGVRIALELYRRDPKRVRALILLCGSVYDSLGRLGAFSPLPRLLDRTLGTAERLGRIPSAVKSLVLRADLVSKSAYLVGGMSRELTPRDPIERLLENLERIDTKVMTNLARSYIRHSARHVLTKVEVPVLLIVGEKDALAPPSHGKQVAAQIANVDYHAIEGATHLAPIEKPGVVHDITRDFLTRRLSTP